MNRTLTYNHTNVKMVYDNLVNLKKQGAEKDFEIRIDDITAVHRTNNLSKFFCFKTAFKPNCSEVSFILYKGNSRRYDKYLLIREVSSHQDPKIPTQEFIDNEIQKALTAYKKESEFNALKEETKAQKEIIAHQKEKIQKLESNKMGDVKSLIEMISLKFAGVDSKSSTKVDSTEVPDIELLKMIQHYQSSCGKEVFNEALGIALQVANHPPLIPHIKEFINQKLKGNEN